jgi:hypothetical protein
MPQNTRSTSFRRRALAGLSAAAIAATTFLAPAAQAAPEVTAELGDTVVYWHPWYLGGGACHTSAAAHWSGASNLLRVDSNAWSSSPFGGCKAKMTINFISARGKIVGSHERSLPTAGSTTDPTWPSHVSDTFNVAEAVDPDFNFNSVARIDLIPSAR